MQPSRTVPRDPLHPVVQPAATAGPEVARCPGCAQEGEEDLEGAIRNLSRKYTDLAELVTRYMSQAGLERGVRASNANVMAEVLARIVGGIKTQPNEIPDCCLVGHRNTNGSFMWFCTGVLVHPRVVLTAAHCADPPAVPVINRIALKAIDQADLSKAEIISVKKVARNPAYTGAPGNDITVLILRQDAKTKPVNLATTADLAAATKTQLVGFGNDDIHSTRGFGIQRKVEVDITNIRRSPSDNLDAAEEALGFESDMEFTAGGDGFDSCNGDSGGPAYITVGTTRKVGGLTSRGFSTSSTPCGEGGVYTRVDSELAFINSVVKSAGITAKF